MSTGRMRGGGNENGEWMCDEEDIFKGVEIESVTELWVVIL